MPSVITRGQRIGFGTEGDAGTPVLLVMGFGLSARAWAPQVPTLAEQHRVVWFDNRGIGESEPSKGPYDLRDVADDAIGVLDHLGHETAHVVGVSMGGMTAQRLAERHPSRVRSLTLIATHPGGVSPFVVPTMGGLGLFLRANTSRGDERIAALRELLYPATFRQRIALDDELARDFSADSLESFTVPAERRTLLYQLKAVLAHDGTRFLRSFDRFPTLVIRPDKDVLVRPENSDRIHRLIPRSTLVAFADAGHGVTHQEKRAVNAQLLSHFAAADRGRPAGAV